MLSDPSPGNEADGVSKTGIFPVVTAMKLSPGSGNRDERMVFKNSYTTTGILEGDIVWQQ
jgi:hypothetical protein